MKKVTTVGSVIITPNLIFVNIIDSGCTFLEDDGKKLKVKSSTTNLELMFDGNDSDEEAGRRNAPNL